MSDITDQAVHLRTHFQIPEEFPILCARFYRPLQTTLEKKHFLKTRFDNLYDTGDVFEDDGGANLQ
jgi:hypothetical protein